MFAFPSDFRSFEAAAIGQEEEPVVDLLDRIREDRVDGRVHRVQRAVGRRRHHGDEVARLRAERAREAGSEHDLVRVGIGQERPRHDRVGGERGVLLERGNRPGPDVRRALLAFRDEAEERQLRHGLHDARVLLHDGGEALPVVQQQDGRLVVRLPRCPRVEEAQVAAGPADRRRLERRERLGDEAGRHRDGDESDDDDRPREERPARVALEVPRREARPPAHARAPAARARPRRRGRPGA